MAQFGTRTKEGEEIVGDHLGGEELDAVDGFEGDSAMVHAGDVSECGDACADVLVLGEG